MAFSPEVIPWVRASYDAHKKKAPKESHFGLWPGFIHKFALAQRRILILFAAPMCKRLSSTFLCFEDLQISYYESWNSNNMKIFGKIMFHQGSEGQNSCT